jgi:glucose/arabinose dehydrogenase
VADGFDQPVLLTAPPGDDRLFVVERSGAIRIVGQDQPFLDIDDRVNSEEGIEPGLLGLAFHPEYADNGRFFVFYYRSDAPRTRLAEYRVSDDPNVADPDSEVELMGFDKPTTRHNGGMIQFGPDGMLWVSTGEGGDASTHAQDPNTQLSAILRVDASRPGSIAPAGDNPFIDNPGGDPAVWAWGLRNPWRFWIDPEDALVYLGVVGHEDWEEIDVVPVGNGGGYNFGWLRMEGTVCFQSGCDAESENLTLPVYEYGHDEGCSVTGGIVYRGGAIPEFDGRYFFGDWCGEWVRSFTFDGTSVSDARTDFEAVGQINGFGVDDAGEMYVLTYGGDVLKMVGLR